MALPGGWTIDNGVQPFQPYAIVGGPDGNLWMTEVGVNAIGRLTLDGRHDSFPVPDLPLVAREITGIAAGSDGNVWFGTCGNQEPAVGGVGRITPDGQITQFALPTGTAANRCPMYLTAGPDGNMWFSEWGANALGRVTADGTMAEFFLPSTSDWRDVPGPFAVGPDGNFWFGEPSRIGRVTLAGEPTFFSSAVVSNGGATMIGPMVSGADGSLWWTGPFSDRFIRIETSGRILPAVSPTQLRQSQVMPAGWNSGVPETFGDLTPGPDGNLWYAGVANLGCLTPDGSLHDIPVPSGLPVGHIAWGADGALWFTEPGEDRIGRLSLN